MPEISVVIPTYRRPELLITCLQHLELQVLEKDLFEVIVVSDGEDEKTRQAVDIYKRGSALRLVYMNTPLRKGPAAARNMGWRNSLSAMIAFTDDDCRPESGWLLAFYNRLKDFSLVKEKQTKANEPVLREEQLSAVNTGVSEVKNKSIREVQNTLTGETAELVFSGYTIVPIDKNPTDHALNTHGLQFADFITANCACSRKALELAGGFDERFGTAWREDSDLEFSFINHGIPIIKVREAVVVHPVREAPWGFSIKEQKKGQYDALLYKKHPLLYRKRLSPRIIIDFYFIMLTDLICLVSIIFGWWYIAVVTFIAVFIMLTAFFLKRVKKTRKTTSHIWEMWVTSMIIPFLSVYWRVYGAIKYRVFFI